MAISLLLIALRDAWLNIGLARTSASLPAAVDALEHEHPRD